MLNIRQNRQKRHQELHVSKKRVFVKIDKGMIKQLVSKKLYDDPKAALRELYANAIRACREAEQIGSTPEIKITVNPFHSTIEIEETDSMGMTSDVFEKVYSFLGRSTNFDGTNPGQFGIGMASYYALSDTILVESYARENDERLCFLGRDVDIFDDLTTVNPPTLNSYGTKIRLVVRPDTETPKKKQIETLVAYIEQMARFGRIKTILDVENNEGLDITPGARTIGPADPAKVLETDGERLLIIKSDDFDLIYEIATDDKEIRVITLAGMPMPTENIKIEALARIPKYILLIHDEQKYEPTASRDGLLKKINRKHQRRDCEKISQRGGPNRHIKHEILDGIV